MHILYGTLRKQVRTHQTPKCTMFFIELSERIQDRENNGNTYTNYKAVLFAKTEGQINYYLNNLVEGAYVVLSGDKLKVDLYDKGDGSPVRPTNNIENARLLDVFNPSKANGNHNNLGGNQGGNNGNQGNQNFAPRQQQQQQQQQQQPQHQGNWGQTQQPQQQQQQQFAPQQQQRPMRDDSDDMPS